MMPADYELNKLKQMLKDFASSRTCGISDELGSFLCAKSKMLRPKLIFLFSKALGLEIDDKIYNTACAAELAHNAALIHDDILDSAEIRRGRVSLNVSIGNNLSVLAGDILLSEALRRLAETENIEVIRIFSGCLFKMCRGEINQKKSAYTVPSMEEYIKKSQDKTAELFKAALAPVCILKKIPHQSEIEEFALCFGTAFQIKDDLINTAPVKGNKPQLSDIKSGIYTAPVIYLNSDENIQNWSADKIIEAVQNKKYIDKTKDLIREYASRASAAAGFLPDNIYKDEIISAAENLYKADING